MSKLSNLIKKLNDKQRSGEDAGFKISNRLREMFPKYNIGYFSYGKPIIDEWSDGSLSNPLTIGKYCSIAEDVHFLLGGNHRVDWVSTYPFNSFCEEFQTISGHPASKGPIVVGNDVWIGSKAVILSGVTIGDGAVIGANAVISQDVAPYSVVVGNPQRFVKYRFSEKQIEELLSVRWWDFDVDTVKRLVPLMMSDDVDSFIAAAREEGTQKAS
jgi:acetyltransferase-like isoleucine patch superfamily enzyme